jgi:transcriptional regulator GlxA family with amidase domain
MGSTLSLRSGADAVERTWLRVRFLLALVLASLGSCAAAPESASVPAAEPALAVGFLLIDGVYNTELTAPYDIFQHTVFHVQPGMRVFTVAPSRAPVTSFEGLRILPDHTFEDAPPIDVLVVPSAEHNLDSDLEDERLIGWVRRTGARARFVVSLCDGAFVLAQAGLLDGRAATTFPADLARFRELFGTRVDVRAGPSFVHDGPALTSVGGAKSFDAALYLCELLYGPEKARGIARGLVIDWDLGSVAHERR